MTKPTLSDLSPRYQAQVRAQLAGVPHPKTINVQPVQDSPEQKWRKSQRTWKDVCEYADASKKISFKVDDACDYFVSAGLPRPVTEHRFMSDRRFRFDYAWVEQHVALEVEGGIWTGGRHTRGAGFLRDMEKYNHAAVRGWYVVRCTPSTLRTTETVKMIRALLEK